MATTRSIFGEYANSTNLQYLVDRVQDQFAPVWFPRYFTWETQKVSLNFITVIGKSRVEAAASVVNRGSKAPLRGRQSAEKLAGSVPPIMEKFHLDEETLRDHIMLRDLPSVGDEEKKNQIIDLITNDVKKAATSTLKRLDIFALEGISTGKYSLSVLNNPDGVVLPNALDLLMPATNKRNASVAWATVASAKPITVDWAGMVQYGRTKNVRFSKALMTWDSFYAMIATDEVKNLFSTMFGAKGSGKLLPTLGGLNEFLASQSYPVIEIVDESIGIEKDGVITPYNPFENTNVAFIPEGNLGVIHNAYAIEQLRPLDQVSYAKSDRTLISKWGDNDPYNEWTKAELNAMPGIEAIDSIALLSRTVAF